MAAATAAVGLASAAALSAYLNAKFHLGKDLTHIYYQHRGERYQARLKAQNRINIWATFCENADKFADGDCIWYSDPATSPPTVHTYTWREARDYACRYAQWFLDANVRPGDCVGFYLQNSPDFVLGWLGLLAIGCYPAMINYNLVGGALVHCVKIAECKVLLVDEDFRDRALQNEELQQLGVRMHVVDREFRERLSRIPAEMPSAEYAKDVGEKTRLALRYTSGTTGYPKGVMATVGRYYARLASQFTQMGIHPLQADGSGDRWYICMPMCHSTAGSAVIICMIMPTTLCIGKKFSASRFWDEVRTSRSTMATYVGEIARYLLALPPSPLDRQHALRMVYGNGMRPDVWGRFQERFGIPKVCEFYGSTEGGLSHLNIQQGDFLRDAVGHDGLLRRWQLQGQMVPVQVDAETNEIVRDPATGGGLRGYWRNAEATDKKLARDVFRPGDLWYRTGDSLRRDADGRWSFLDRLGDTFRWKGENVATAEVSECLGRYPGVIDANVYGVQVPNHDGRAGCAALMLDPEAARGFDLAGLLKHARRDLPGFAVPLFLRIVPTGSLNSMGLKQEKVQPRAEGVDPAKVRGDRLYVLRGDRYVVFSAADWADLATARARL
ncbi:AMP-binding enzyme domain-containing protein [Cladophialophora immunda]|nr:AMP-binding enzyme domain-containing protein [Cladophialophora immunda]